MRALAAALLASLALVACQAEVANESHAECSSCHQAEFQSARGHVGVRPNTCWSCHTQDAWHPATDVVSSGSRREGEAEGIAQEAMVQDASASVDAAIEPLAVDAGAKPKKKRVPPPVVPTVIPPTPTTAPTLDIPPSGASRRRGK